MMWTLDNNRLLRSGRDVEQFCFGSAATAASTEAGKLEVGEAASWSRAGVSRAWR